MTEATAKQISFAESLGIEDAASYSKEALSELINKKTGGKPKTPYKDSNQGKQPSGKADEPAISQIIISRAEKPHSFEFGKPGARHKIYYEKIEELQVQIEALHKAGLIEENDETATA